jgi:Ca2+-binding EF-hand superfamily protein
MVGGLVSGEAMNMRATCLLWAGLLAGALFAPTVMFAGESETKGKPPEVLFAELDKNSDGKLTADEVPEAQKRFFNRLLRVADSDNDGALTSAEFIAGMRPDELQVSAPPNAGGTRGGPGQFDPNQVFQRFDRNKDGKLELGEIPEQARERFQPVFDRLQKKELTREEFVRGLERLRAAAGGGLVRPSGGLARGARLSKEDLQKAVARFDELDRNKDGYLDAGELFGKANGTEDVPEMQPAAPPDEKAPKIKPGAANGRAISDPNGQAAIGRFDADGDGRISRSEARGKLSENFDKIDVNGDGFLGRDEIRKALTQLTDK